MSPLIDTSDLCQKPRADRKQTELKNDSCISVTENDGNGQVATVSEESTEQQQQRQSHDAWVNRTFVKPMRALEELSSFTSLSFLMKILATVAVTSCSAERAMSRVKIIKNRLRYNAGRLVLSTDNLGKWAWPCRWLEHRRNHWSLCTAIW